MICLFLACFVPKSYAKFTLQNNFIGLNGKILENVQSTLNAKQTALEPLDDAKIQKFYQDSWRDVRDAVKPFGYFKTVVTSSLSNKGSRYTATYNVTLNEPLKINSTDITLSGPGANDRLLNIILKKINLPERLHGQAF